MKYLLAAIGVWAILAISGGLYSVHLEKKYDPEGYAKAHAYTPPEDSNYDFCDMLIVKITPLFLSPSGCHNQ